MTDETPEPDDDPPLLPRNDLSLFVEEWTQAVQFGMISMGIVCPEGKALGRKCDDPECDICHGVIVLEPGELSIGCGCGQWWHGDDAAEQYEVHECPLRGVELSAEEMLDLVNDPDGRRRVHAAETANLVDEKGYAVQPVFPTDEDGVHFAYTIGLWPSHGGEFMVRGFGDHCGELVEFFAGHVVAGTFALTPGVYRFKDVDVDPSAVVRVEAWRGDPGDFGQAMRHHDTDLFPMFQVVLADDEGRFPGDPGCECAEFQTKGLS